MSLKYKRIMLKISGEALAGKKSFGLDSDTLSTIAQKVKECSDMGCEIAIVVGGGNFWRGRTGEGMDRTRADHMGMLATVINSLALLDALEHHGVSARVQTAIEMRQIAEPYIRLKAMRAEREIRTSRPTPRRRSVRRKSMRKSSFLQRRLMRYTTATRTSTPTRSSLTA